jgi:hypothetical protein
MIVIIFPALLFAGGSVTLPGDPTLALELLTRIMTFVEVPAMVLPFASTDETLNVFETVGPVTPVMPGAPGGPCDPGCP